MAGLGHYNCCEILMVPVPAAHFLRTVELVKVFVDLSGLEIKHLSVIEVNLLDPLELRSDAVLHVVIAHVDKDAEAAAEQLSVDAGSVVFAVGDSVGHRAVGANELIWFGDVQSATKLIKSVAFGEEICETVIVDVIFIIKVRCVHLLYTSNGLRNVVENVFAGS